jgi:hypothetical protein
MLKRAIHGAISTNCIADVVRSKCVHSGMQTARPNTEPTSAVQRAGAGLRSLPMASTATPKAIGSQIVSDKHGDPRDIVLLIE